jgi:hypothetical protein
MATNMNDSEQTACATAAATAAAAAELDGTGDPPEPGVVTAALPVPGALHVGPVDVRWIGAEVGDPVGADAPRDGVASVGSALRTGVEERPNLRGELVRVVWHASALLHGIKGWPAGVLIDNVVDLELDDGVPVEAEFLVEDLIGVLAGVRRAG